MLYTTDNINISSIDGDIITGAIKDIEGWEHPSGEQKFKKIGIKLLCLLSEYDMEIKKELDRLKKELPILHDIVIGRILETTPACDIYGYNLGYKRK
ncbi:MAG TPA: hypothetical protein PLW93_05855 [Candidatus Absconditabacterales bacterium]|nr:hypothetical protein [Candidatus Absconditabacterales bacterium]